MRHTSSACAFLVALLFALLYPKNAPLFAQEPSLYLPLVQCLPTTGLLSDMTLIPPGPFLMGCDDSLEEVCGGPNERPLHTVTLSAYAMDRYEASNARYATCVAAGACDPPHMTGSHDRDPYFADPAYADYPVLSLDWYDAVAFCEFEGKRLPTEAEWEKAARGTTPRIYAWGNQEPTCDLANFGEWNANPICVGDSAPVDSLPAGVSPQGLYNMSGNVWEWVSDWDSNDYYAVSPPVNPPGPAEGTWKVLRGGSWWDDSWRIRTAWRDRWFPSDFMLGAGVRCARDVPK